MTRQPQASSVVPRTAGSGCTDAIAPRGLIVHWRSTMTSWRRAGELLRVREDQRLRPGGRRLRTTAASVSASTICRGARLPRRRDDLGLPARAARVKPLRGVPAGIAAAARHHTAASRDDGRAVTGRSSSDSPLLAKALGHPARVRICGCCSPAMPATAARSSTSCARPGDRLPASEGAQGRRPDRRRDRRSPHLLLREPRPARRTARAGRRPARRGGRGGHRVAALRPSATPAARPR